MQFEKELSAERTNIPGLVVFELPVHGGIRSKPPLKPSTSNRFSEKTHKMLSAIQKVDGHGKEYGIE